MRIETPKKKIMNVSALQAKASGKDKISQQVYIKVLHLSQEIWECDLGNVHILRHQGGGRGGSGDW